MAHWTNKLNIHDAWVKCEDDGNFHALAKTISEKLSQIDFGPDFNDERDGIVEAFEDLSIDKTATVGEFDSILEELYSFGDIKLDNNWNGKKLLWVQTF